jgi:hypothetical protein
MIFAPPGAPPATLKNAPERGNAQLQGMASAILNDITKVKKISRRFAFEAKADSSKRHQ